MHRLAVLVLALLYQEYHQEGNYCCSGVDDQLPGFRVMKYRPADCPSQHNDERQRKGKGRPSPSGHVRSEAIERAQHFMMQRAVAVPVTVRRFSPWHALISAVGICG